MKRAFLLSTLGFLCGLAASGYALQAIAQVAPAVAAAPQVVVQSPWAEVISTIVNAVVAIVLPIALYKFTQWSGIQVEAKERDKLHSAVLTGLYLALGRFGIGVALNPENRSALVDQTLQWINKSGAPGAQQALKLTDGEVRSLIESRIGAIENVPAIAVAPAVVAPSGVAVRPA